MISVQNLRQISLLNALDDDELKQLGTVLRERKAPKGSYIVYAEDPGPNLMFLAEGEVKITLIGDEGKEIVIAHLAAGEFFGEIALLTDEERSANVVALSDCLLYMLSKEDFEQHLLENTGLTHALLRVMACRLRSAATKIGDLALFDVYRRVARTLKTLAKKESSEDEALVIQQRPTHQELAALVGTSREMVTRALKGLEEDGFIEVEGKRIVVHGIPL